MTDRSIRVLLVDGQVEDSRWVEELLAEFEECRYGGGWMHGIQVFHLERLNDALAVLGDTSSPEPFHAVLLNPTLPDSFGLHSFLRIQAKAPDLPVIVLSELDDPDLAISLVRAGAQDFLAKTQLDSAPLAKALRLALERQRISRDLRTQCWRDELTGLHNRRGFEAVCRQDLLHARTLGLHVSAVAVEICALEELGFFYGKDEQQLALIDCAEILSEVAESVSGLARIAPHRFAFPVLRPEDAPVTDLLMAMERRMAAMRQKAHRRQLRVRFGVARQQDGTEAPLELLARAERALCENVGDLETSPVPESARLSSVAAHP